MKPDCAPTKIAQTMSITHSKRIAFAASAVFVLLITFLKIFASCDNARPVPYEVASIEDILGMWTLVQVDKQEWNELLKTDTMGITKSDVQLLLKHDSVGMVASFPIHDLSRPDRLSRFVTTPCNWSITESADGHASVRIVLPQFKMSLIFDLVQDDRKSGNLFLLYNLDPDALRPWMFRRSGMEK